MRDVFCALVRFHVWAYFSVFEVLVCMNTFLFLFLYRIVYFVFYYDVLPLINVRLVFQLKTLNYHKVCMELKALNRDYTLVLARFVNSVVIDNDPFICKFGF